MNTKNQVLAKHQINQVTTMYETNQAISGLNKVPGFNPLLCLRRAKSRAGDQEVLKLDLRYKKLWFRLAYPTGRLKLNALRITDQFAIIEAKLFFHKNDTEPVANFTVHRSVQDTPEGNYLKTAQEEAMDAVLTDAGFGLQFSDVSIAPGEDTYGSEIPLTSAKILSTMVAVSGSGQQTGSAQTIGASMNHVNKNNAEHKAALGSSLTVFVQDNVSGSASAAAEPISEGLPVPEPDVKQPVTELQLPAGESNNKTPAVALISTDLSHEPSELPVTAQNDPPAFSELPAATKDDSLSFSELPATALNTESAAIESPDKEDTSTAVISQSADTPAASIPTGTDTTNTPVNFSNYTHRETTPAASQSETTSLEQLRSKPVAKLLSTMTYEDACNFFVDIGTCKGMTMKEVAERRPPSLKWYIQGYSGGNNLLRAAAQIMLDSLSVPKAG